jgi:hypothetical protein
MSRAQSMYVYVVLAATAIIAAIGASVLLGALIDQVWPGRVISGNPSSAVAMGISLLAVAAPVWVFHWRLALKKVAADPSERERGLRQACLAFLMAVSITVAGFGAGGIISDLSGGRASVSGDVMARLFIWGLVWAFHWREARKTWRAGHMGRSWHRLYLYVAAAGTLVAGVIGLARLLDGLLSAAYDAALPGEVLYTGAVWTRGLQESLGAAVTGLGLWALHWRTGAKGDRGSTLRDVYVTLAAAAAVITGMAAAGVILQALFRMPIGSLGEPASARIGDLTGWAGLWLAASLPWLYYTPLLLWPGRAIEPSYASPWTGWAYRYAAMAAGMAALGAAAVFGIAILVGLTVPAEDVFLKGPGEVREAVAAMLAAAVLGAVVWGGMGLWLRRVPATPDRDQVERLYQFGITGAGLLAAVGGAATALYIFLNDALNSRLGGGTADTARWALAIAVSGGVTAYLHSRAIKGGVRGAIAETLPARRKRVVLIAPAGSEVLRAALERALGREVEWRVDVSAGAGPAESPDMIGSIQLAVERIEAAPGRNVLAVWTTAGLLVSSYD